MNFDLKSSNKKFKKNYSLVYANKPTMFDEPKGNIEGEITGLNESVATTVSVVDVYVPYIGCIKNPCAKMVSKEHTFFYVSSIGPLFCMK